MTHFDFKKDILTDIIHKLKGAERTAFLMVLREAGYDYNSSIKRVVKAYKRPMTREELTGPGE